MEKYCVMALAAALVVAINITPERSAWVHEINYARTQTVLISKVTPPSCFLLVNEREVTLISSAVLEKLKYFQLKSP